MTLLLLCSFNQIKAETFNNKNKNILVLISWSDQPIIHKF